MMEMRLYSIMETQVYFILGKHTPHISVFGTPQMWLHTESKYW